MKKETCLIRKNVKRKTEIQILKYNEINES
jgi:hypothetical protein